MRSMASEEGGETCTVIQGKELYELEVCGRFLWLFLFCVFVYLFILREILIFSRTPHQLQLSNSFAFNPQVMLRVKESEVQYLKQEINSLKDELQAAQRVSGRVRLGSPP